MTAATRVLAQARAAPLELAGSGVIAVGRVLHALIAAPSILFLATLGVMLFRPPDLDLFHLDRIAFVLLVFAVMLRAFLLRQQIPWVGGVSLPMAGLIAITTAGALSQPYDAQTWSLFAAKFLVPFVLFHLSILVFEDQKSIRMFESFALIVLAYLSFTSVCWLAGLSSLIYPRFILNESLGIHFDRARGPFLQAVANGVALNILGVVALDSFRRKRLRGLAAFLLLASLPVAILATMTRAVWLSFSGSIVVLMFLRSNQRLRRACFALTLAGGAGLVVALGTGHFRSTLEDRAQESGPVEFRVAIYRASWDLVRAKPLLGWGQNQMNAEIVRRIPEFRVDAFCTHNTYLELVGEQGVLGLTLYAALFIGLLKLGRRSGRRKLARDHEIVDFRSIWPLLLAVYLFNAFFVVMSYQFVNSFMFTMAGIIAANRTRDPRFDSHVRTI